MMMRILVISNYFPPVELGGWDQLTRDVSQRLQERGHEVLVLTSNYRQAELTTPEANVLRTLHLESPDHVHYHPGYALAHRRHEAENRAAVQEAVRTFNPDVVYVNGMWNMSHNVVQTAEQLCPGRVVYYMASYWPAEPDAHTAYWTDASGKWWTSLPKWMLGKLLLPFIHTTPRNQLDFRLVLCVSAFMLEQMVARAGLPRERLRVVHNGIELDKFTIRPLPTSTDTLRLLYAGRLSPDKGVHTVVAALHHLRQLQPDPALKLTILGSGAPAYEAYLRQQAQELGVIDLIEFRGFVPREQMPAILAAHDVLVFPSIWAEPLARMVQEAMACGLVVIGTDTGGTPEILYDGENGLVFPADDAQTLAEKMNLLLQDRSLPLTLAQAARRTVEARFTLERMVDELEAYFAQVIGAS
ncbi:MAG: glycosyltransferase family 4 protein [Chloroflexota bacterium]